MCQRQYNAVLPRRTSFWNLLTLSYCSPSNLNLRTCVWNIHVPRWNKCSWFVGSSNRVQKAIQHRFTTDNQFLEPVACHSVRTWGPVFGIHIFHCEFPCFLRCALNGLYICYLNFSCQHMRGRVSVDWLDSSFMQVCCILSNSGNLLLYHYLAGGQEYYQEEVNGAIFKVMIFLIACKWSIWFNLENKNIRLSWTFL